MKLQRRAEESISIAFLDVITCGIGAIILLGGIGYGVDQWRGHSHWGLLVGLVLGLIVGFYELAKAVFKR